MRSLLILLLSDSDGVRCTSQAIFHTFSIAYHGRERLTVMSMFAQMLLRSVLGQKVAQILLLKDIGQHVGALQLCSLRYVKKHRLVIYLLCYFDTLFCCREPRHILVVRFYLGANEVHFFLDALVAVDTVRFQGICVSVELNASQRFLLT